MDNEYRLWTHPSAGALRIDGVSAGLTRSGPSTLGLEFRVNALRGVLSLTDGSGERRNGLWKSTCFELFIGEPLTSEYREFNFSPGGDWAAYHFDGYRAGMRNEELPMPPEIISDWKTDSLVLNAQLSLHDLSDGSRLNFAAVIDERDFHQSLWATDHAEKPDFHARHCFGQELPSLAKP